MALDQINTERNTQDSYTGWADFTNTLKLLGIWTETETEKPTETEIQEPRETTTEDETLGEAHDALTEAEMAEELDEQDGKREIELWLEWVAITQDLYDLQKEILNNNNIA